MKNIKGHLIKHAKQIKRLARPLVIPEQFMHEGVPYFSQWESPELVRQILASQLSTDDDPNWRHSGARTKKEYHDWSWNGCGMACTKMLLAHISGKTVPLVELGKKCTSYGGYTMPLENSIGLLYKPYIRFVEKEFNWKARIGQGMSLQELMHELSQGSYIIASVNWQIRDPKSKPKSKGGHLVLLLGYDKIRREFYFHNPSGISKETQQYAAISFNDFKKFFSERGIVIMDDFRRRTTE